jgi:small subunit ribosomal protein S20
MANHKSALKRARQNEIQRGRNRAGRTRLRTEIKRFRTAVEKGEIETARGLLSSTLSVIDRSVQKGVLQGNAAARHKSRLTRLLNGSAAAQP